MATTILLLIIYSVFITHCLCKDATLYFSPKFDHMKKINDHMSKINGHMINNNDHMSRDNGAGVKLSFASYYSDHMVLQQAPKKANIWGHSSTEYIGKRLTVVLTSADGLRKSTHQTNIVKGGASNTALWSVQLSPQPAGGPYTLNVTVGTTILTLSDVLFGDVWLCSGQSNMQFTVKQMYAEMSDHEYNITDKYQDIRIFSVGRKGSTVPLQDLEAINFKWSRPSKESLGSGIAFSAVCWLFGRHLYETLDYPIGLLETDYGGTPDEAWSSPDALKKCGISNQENPRIYDEVTSIEKCLGVCGPHTNSGLWNAMVHPLINMTIYGAIWYQGEADEAKSNYYCTFPAMISDWRSKFHEGTKGQTDPLFPFGFVQLAPNRPPIPGSITTGFPSIRWQQTAKYGYVPNKIMPNTFMAAALDLPDFQSPWGSIHPRDKETVGTRLAAAGLAQVFKYSLKTQGPLPTKIVMGSKEMKIMYEQSVPINTRNQWGFEICCPTDQLAAAAVCDYNIFGSPWQEAYIVKHDPESVTVSTQNCTHQIKAMRYLWRESPCEYKMCAVYSVENQLPAPPVYITENQLIQLDAEKREFMVKL